MPLTNIASYALPTESELPEGRVHWDIDTARVALLVHDVQAYFLRPYQLGQSPMREVLQNVQRLRQLCRQLAIPAYFSAQPGEQERGERGLLWDLWGPGIINAPEFAHFAPGAEPEPGDTVIHKRRYSAFVGTSLEEQLRAQGRDQLLITGVYGHIGCLATATDGFMRGIQPFLVADAIGDFSRQDHDIALRQVARTCGVVASTAGVLAQLHGQRAEQSAVMALG